MSLVWETARAFRAPTLGLLLALVVGSTFLVISGEEPLILFASLRQTCFTSFGLGHTLFYTTPLIFTGLSVAISFRCGLFNIGGEGQLYMGSISIIALVYLFPRLPAALALPLACLSAAIGGGLWGAVAGWLKAVRGSHEVIVTILLNFIGISIVSYLILYPFKDPQSQNPETIKVPEAFEIASLHDVIAKLGGSFFKATPVNLALPLAILCAVLCYLFLYRTTYGFELRSVGESSLAARYSGISIKWNTIGALFLSGALAGLVGVNEILGYEHRMLEGFSPQYGFTGIAVSLLARNHPLGILASALLFGALQNSARELEFLSETVTKEASMILQGTLIAFVAADYLFERLFREKSARV